MEAVPFTLTELTLIAEAVSTTHPMNSTDVQGSHSCIFSELYCNSDSIEEKAVVRWNIRDQHF